MKVETVDRRREYRGKVERDWKVHIQTDRQRKEFTEREGTRARNVETGIRRNCNQFYFAYGIRNIRIETKQVCNNVTCQDASKN